MNKQNQFSLEVKERAVRLGQEHHQEFPHCGQQLNRLRLRWAVCHPHHWAGSSWQRFTRESALLSEALEMRTNALAETINGLYKTGLIHRGAPWKSKAAVELTPLERVF